MKGREADVTQMENYEEKECEGDEIAKRTRRGKKIEKKIKKEREGRKRE